MDKFGPYTAEVQEVIDFLESWKLLSEPFRPDLFDDFDTRVVHTFEVVDRFMSHYKPNPEHWYDVENWRDLTDSDYLYNDEYKKCIDRNEARSEKEWDWRRISENIIETNDQFLESMVQRMSVILPNENFKEIAYDISNYFEMIMRYRAECGRNNLFFEKLFRVFQAFGYGCSWVGGLHPKGQLVVFSSKEK